MTRKDRSKLLVAVTGVLVLAGATVFAVLSGTGDPPAGDADRPPAARDGVGDTGAAAAPARPSAAAHSIPPPGDTTTVARGRELFRSVGCTRCHSAEGAGRRRLPLDGVGARLSADTLRLWVVDPRAVDPGVRKPAYDDLPREDVEALVVYMESLDGPGGD